MTEYRPAKPRPNTWPQLIVVSLLVAAWFAWRTISTPGVGQAFGSALASRSLDLFLASWFGASFISLLIIPLLAAGVLELLLRKVKENKQLRNMGILWLAALLGSLAPFAVVGASLMTGR